MLKKVFPFIMIVAFSVLLVACNGENTTKDKGDTEGKLTIFTTIYPLQYFTERIGGDLVEVENIIPPGADAHTFEITMKKMIDIADSHAFIRTGTSLEGFADSVAASLKNDDVLIVEATENVRFITPGEHEHHDEEVHVHGEDEDHVHDSHEEGHGEYEHHEEEADHHHHHGDVDPHVWIDPIRSITIAENIKNVFIELDSSNQSVFESNFLILKEELEALHAEFEEMVKTAENKTFVVSHSAYGYWEDTYGLKQIGISGLSPTNEPSQKQLMELIDRIKDNDIQYIFFDQNSTNKLAEIVVSETGTTALTLHNLESLTEDDLKNKDDYFSIMRRNIEALEKEFQ